MGWSDEGVWGLWEWGGDVSLSEHVWEGYEGV